MLKHIQIKTNHIDAGVNKKIHAVNVLDADIGEPIKGLVRTQIEVQADNVVIAKLFFNDVNIDPVIFYVTDLAVKGEKKDT